MKLIAIDYGEKRVGVASTDESGSFALPRAVWPNNSALLNKILELKDKEGIKKIIIGESRNLDQQANPIFRGIEKLKNELEKRGVEVTLHPELYTTLEAERLQGKTEMLDASAAALILKSYLETINSLPPGIEPGIRD